MNREAAENKRRLVEYSEVMNRLLFVRWDRCVATHDGMIVYGWIAREDGRSDYVQLDFSDWGVGFTTSSAEHSLEIHRLLYGEDNIDRHTDCDRVEDVFGGLVENAIRLA